ncbi:MAG: TetR family transcriptional regulator [Holophagales bacterium]|nr:MAG: TetR family transcriptional regulator [Holophagales bacterium]
MVQISTIAADRALPEKVRERRREILAAAGRVFRRRGLHASGMRDVAAELEMTAGSLYYYFPSKQALLAYCQEDALDGLLATVGRIERLGLDADTALASAVVTHVVRLHETTPGSLAHLEVEALDEPHRQPILSRRNAYERALRRLVVAGIDTGRFRSGLDPRTAVRALLGAVNWTAKWFHPSAATAAAGGARHLGFELAELLVRGMLAPRRELRLPPPELVDTLLREATDAE